MRCGNCGSALGHYHVPGGTRCRGCDEFVPDLEVPA